MTSTASTARGQTLWPFTKPIATENLYPSRGHQEVQGRLNFALQERLPALITGDVGIGKSTALRAFAQSLDRNVYHVVYLSNPHLWRFRLYSAGAFAKPV